MISNNYIVTNLNWGTQTAFEENFVYILDKHAPKKTKILRENQKTHFNKNLSKQMMTSQKILVTFSSLSDNETWWQI